MKTARRFLLVLMVAASAAVLAWPPLLFAAPPATPVAQPAGPSPAARSPMVLAYYYPWYIKGDWSRHGYVGAPELGNYGTDDPAIAEKHVAWAADHKLDGFMVSWWGKDHLCEKHFKAGLLKAKNLGRVRFAIYYEALGILDKEDGKQDGVVDFAHPGPLKRMTEDFTYLAATYFKHPQYIRFGKRPFVGIYVTRTFRNFKRDHLAQLRKAVGMDLFVMADEPFFGRQRTPAKAWNGLRENDKGHQAVFDAYSAYNMFENARVKEGESALAYQSREALPIFRDWAKDARQMPCVFPSYHDFRGHKPLPGSDADFATLLDAAHTIATPGKGDVPRVLLITSFNEWWEGTTIEPAKEYGTSFLEAVKAYKTRWEKYKDGES